jgi:CreA protein
MKYHSLIAALALLTVAWSANARDIGAVTTAIKILGPNHKIVVTAFDDPKIKGITCYIARPRTGGIKGGLGLAEDPSLASVSCVQTGPVSYIKEIEADENGEEVFDESRSLIFKSLSVNRLYDAANGSLVYVVRTTRIIEGAPTTSISVVTPMAWNGISPGEALLDK